MALIEPSALINGGSGKVGDLVFAHNRGGFYARAHVTPANPRSTLQTTWRNRLTTATRAWSSTLTEDQRNQWREFAARFSRTNALGDKRPYTAQTLYVRGSTYSLFLTGSVLTTPPAPRIPAYVIETHATGSVGAKTFYLYWTLVNGSAETQILGQAGPPLPGSRTGNNGTWSFFANPDGLQAQPVNEWNRYTGRYGTPTAGQKTWFKLIALDPSYPFPGPYVHNFLIWSP